MFAIISVLFLLAPVQELPPEDPPSFEQTADPWEQQFIEVEQAFEQIEFWGQENADEGNRTDEW